MMRVKRLAYNKREPPVIMVKAEVARQAVGNHG
jgi:hypothetical protein